MIPRGLLSGQPIEHEDVQVGDVIDTYDPSREHQSRYHRRFGQVVEKRGPYSCDIETDYGLICRNFGLWIQLRKRAKE